MGSVFADFHEAQRLGSGHLLASTLAPINTEQNPRRLESFSQISNYQTIAADSRYYLLQDRSIQVKLPKPEGLAWIDIFASLWTCIRELVSIEHSVSNTSWSKAFDSYKDLCNRLVRGYSNDGLQAWTVPCLYTAGKYLRILAIKADTESKAQDTNGFNTSFGDDIMGKTNKNDKLEQAAWVINRMFTICLSDRSDLSESRKWGIYSTTNLLFKTYFRLNSISLCANVLRALTASAADIPPLQLFPAAHRCTFLYYRGVIAFLSEHYGEAEEHLLSAFKLCPPSATHNREQILTYLIPCHMMTARELPSKTLLAPYPALDNLLAPICTAIRAGSLSAFDAALARAETALIRRRIYLTLERGRDLCLRNLFRKVFLAGGFEEPPAAGATAAGASQTETGPPPRENATPLKMRRTRVPVAEFEAGMRISLRDDQGNVPIGTELVDQDEVECLTANLIYKVGFFRLFSFPPLPHCLAWTKFGRVG